MWVLAVAASMAAVAGPGGTGEVAFPSPDELKCTSCLSVAWELGALLSTEKAGRPLSGERGVAYEVSEARTIDILERLCPLMGGYTLMQNEMKEFGYRRRVEGRSYDPGTAKLLQVRCEQMVEEHEEELEKMIKLGHGIGAGDMEALAFNMCLRMTKSCPDQETALRLLPVTEDYEKLKKEADKRKEKIVKEDAKRKSNNHAKGDPETPTEAGEEL